MTSNNKKPTYDALNKQDCLMDMGEQANSIARIRKYRGDKIQAWDNDSFDEIPAYQAMKRNEIRKGAADEHLKNCRNYWANLTPDDVPQAKYNFNKVDPDTNKDTEKAFDTEVNIRPKGVKDYPSPNPADFNDDEHWKSKDDPVPTGKVVDLDEGNQK